MESSLNSLISSLEGYIWLNWLLLLLLLLVAGAVIVQRNLLIGTLLMSFFSLLLASIHLILDAPDVAFTEAAVGAGISTVLFLGALLVTGYYDSTPAKIHWPALMLCTSVGALLVYSTTNMPPFGSADTETYRHLASYYIQQSREEIQIPNMVTAILASYRGYDTLGEVLVTFTAGICVLLLIGDLKKVRQQSASSPKPSAPVAMNDTINQEKERS
jgi:multicomponent Na+:H+ antiporter subunit B